MEKKFGRPATPEYTKHRFRFSAIEKTITGMMKSMSENDREVAERILEEFKEESKKKSS